MDSEHSIRLIEITRTRVRESVIAGVTDAGEAESQLAQNAQTRAADLIAAIPDIVREATKEHLRLNLRRNFTATVMPIGVEDTTEYLAPTAELHVGTFIDSRRLKHAARLVFDHCEKAGLNPFIRQEKKDGASLVTYVLQISWRLEDDVEKSNAGSQQRRWWLLWLA